MHANRNKKAVKRVEKGMMKANRIRNLFAVFAIVLTTFMITTVFSLGINYMENMKLLLRRWYLLVCSFLWRTSFSVRFLSLLHLYFYVACCS